MSQANERPPNERPEGPLIAAQIDEVQAIFPSDATLQDAIARLTGAGFDRAELSLPDASPASRQATPEQGAANPNTDADNQQTRTLHSSMAGAVGAIAAAGAVVATGGAAAVALGAAAVAGLGAGGLVEAVTGAATATQHESREHAAARGELVLSVRVTDDAKRQRAEAAMRAAGAQRVEALTRSSAAVDSAGWTG